MTQSHASEHRGPAPSGHRLIEPGTYYLVFAALIVVTVVTVLTSFLELGRWHLLVGLLFGTVKAVLVALFFMHLVHSSRVVWLIVAASLFWLGILHVLTLSDYWTRIWQTY